LAARPSYGAGGYLRTPVEKALPVDMDVRSRTDEPNVALVIAMDKSGSMGRCHCDDPRGPSVRSEVGIPKVDIAKQAMLEASSVLGRFDYLGIVAFDEKARWALETQPLVSPDALESSIAGIGAEGGTSIMAGLDQALRNLQGVEARIKHVILITDGWTNTGGYDAVVSRCTTGESRCPSWPPAVAPPTTWNDWPRRVAASITRQRAWTKFPAFS